MKKIITLIILIIPILNQAQEKSTEPRYGISFTGFVKSDFFFD